MLGRVYEMEEDFKHALSILENGYRQAKFQEDLKIKALIYNERDLVKRNDTGQNIKQRGKSQLSRFVD